MKGHTHFRSIQFDNHFGIRDEAVIREAEAILTTLATMKGLPDGDFGQEHFKAVHKHLLGDMYPWAGNFRTAEIQVGNQYAKATPHGTIELETKRVLKQLQSEQPGDLSKVEFADKMAMYYKRLYAISPFPDGNARAARAFLDKFADKHEMQIKWQDVPAEAFHAAVDRSLNGDHEALKQLFRVMTDFKELADLYTTTAVEQKIAEIAKQVGLPPERMPSTALIGTSQADIQKMAHFSQQVITKDLEQYAKGGPTVRDWDKTSVTHEIQQTVGDRQSNRAILSDTLAKLQSGSGSAGTGTRIRGPGM